MPLFAAAARPASQQPSEIPGHEALMAALAALNPDEMSPRDALEALYRLKLQASRKDR